MMPDVRVAVPHQTELVGGSVAQAPRLWVSGLCRSLSCVMISLVEGPSEGFHDAETSVMTNPISAGPRHSIRRSNAFPLQRSAQVWFWSGSRFKPCPKYQVVLTAYGR
jgi:hypothetical protein